MKTDLVVGACIIHEGKILMVHHAKLDMWLFPGGHIELDEDFEQSLRREMKEELGLKIEFLQKEDLPVVDKMIRNLPIPFYSNVHNVGDHDHACLYYLCTVKNKNVKINPESKDFRWMTLDELMNADHVNQDAKNIGKLALEKYEEITRHF